MDDRAKHRRTVPVSFEVDRGHAPGGAGELDIDSRIALLDRRNEVLGMAVAEDEKRWRARTRVEAEGWVESARAARYQGVDEARMHRPVRAVVDVARYASDLGRIPSSPLFGTENERPAESRGQRQRSERCADDAEGGPPAHLRSPKRLLDEAKTERSGYERKCDYDGDIGRPQYRAHLHLPEHDDRPVPEIERIRDL